MKKIFNTQEEYDLFLEMYIDDDIQLIEIIENTEEINGMYIVEI